MKPIVTLYLLVNDEDYRLIHSHEAGLVEITHSKAELPAIGPAHFSGDSTKEEIDRMQLAKHVAKALAAEWGKGIYDRIVISAGPKMLGEMRRDLPKSLHDHIAAELHKDLNKIPLHSLASHFEGAVSAV